jgi:hypothetical protein
MTVAVCFAPQSLAYTLHGFRLGFFHHPTGAAGELGMVCNPSSQSLATASKAAGVGVAKLVEGLDMIAVFQSSPQPLLFTAFPFVTWLHALPLCPCMCPFTSSADDPQQQQVEQVRWCRTLR